MEVTDDRERLIIAGSRDFTNLDLMRWFLGTFLRLSNRGVKEVVSGCARGADSLGELWAEENGIQVKQFPANWDKYHKNAGPIRNKEMALYGDRLVAFWNDGSRGTRDMVATMIELMKPFCVLRLPSFIVVRSRTITHFGLPESVDLEMAAFRFGYKEKS